MTQDAEPRDEGPKKVDDDPGFSKATEDAQQEAPAVETSEDNASAAKKLDPAPGADVASDEDNTRVEREVVGVALAVGDAPRDYDTTGLLLTVGDAVLVETGRDPKQGTVVTAMHNILIDPSTLRRVIRRTAKGQGAAEPVSSRSEKEAFQYCLAKIREYNLPMKLVRAEFNRSGSQVSFYFSSEDRVDFRGLVRDLARQLRARIEMRQIGVRDQAKKVGGIGLCGRELCCSSWIHRFAPVSIRMAKDQGLALNPQKVSGVCGRLLCCLNYEQQAYKELRQGLPKIGKRTQTPLGEGRVREVNVLRGKVRVQLPAGIKEFDRSELCRDCPQASLGNPADQASTLDVDPVVARPQRRPGQDPPPSAPGRRGERPSANSQEPARQNVPAHASDPKSPEARRRPEMSPAQSTEAGAVGSPAATAKGREAPRSANRRPSRGRRRGARDGAENRQSASPRSKANASGQPRPAPANPAQAAVANAAINPAEASDQAPASASKKRRRRRRRKPRGGAAPGNAKQGPDSPGSGPQSND